MTMNDRGESLKDAQVMVAETVDGLQKIMDRISKVSQKYGMKIKVKKTKAVISRHDGGVVSFTRNGKRIE